VLFYVLFVCKCVLPPGDNPIAANKYIGNEKWQETLKDVFFVFTSLPFISSGTTNDSTSTHISPLTHVVCNPKSFPTQLTRNSVRNLSFMTLDSTRKES
jgi:hypothetical protein